MDDFLNSNLFVGLATILTGVAAYAVYLIQKNNAKVQAARVLLTEIRTAEERIAEIRDKVGQATVDLPPVFPTRSWTTYSHLFISDFDQDELRILNEFYDYGGLIEEYAMKNNQFFWITTDERARVTVQKIAQYASEAASLPAGSDRNAYMQERRENLNQLLDGHNLPYSPAKTTNRIKELLVKIPTITTSSCGSKLKRLAQLRI